jgi:hypothetical protein
VRVISGIAREPFVHFAALGALLFALHGVSADRTGDSRDRIVVTRGQIEQLATTFAGTWQRPPTRAELDGLVEDWIRTEVAYRQALALGIDDGDLVVRRRLRQKLEFLTEEATPAPPTDDDLRAYMAAHPDAFRTPARLTFTQIYLSPTRRADAAADARVLLARLTAGADADGGGVGDPTLIPSELADAPRAEVVGMFGESFADAVETAPIGRWWGPVESGYGVHLVLVRRRADAGMATLAEVRSAVEREWQNARRTRLLEESYQRMRARYEIVVEAVEDDRHEGAARR